MDANTRTILRARLMTEEGWKPNPYEDIEHVLTIGYGRNLTDNGISLVEGRMMLDNDIAACLKSCEKDIPGFSTLSEMRQLVLVDMAFNLGIGGLLSFKKMLAAIAVADWNKAAAEMRNSRWARQIPSRAEPLIKIMEIG